ncbi:Norbelladine synthase [Linum grandiflorum]
MKGALSNETAVEAPASAVWAAYRGTELGRLVTELMGDSLGRVDVLEGDGGVGTIVNLIFPPGTPGAGYMKEIFTMVDEEKRVKETETIEGGFRAMGFDLYRVRLEIIETGAESSIVKSTVEYEVDDSKSELVAYVSTELLELMAKVIGNHVVQTCKKTESSASK